MQDPTKNWTQSGLQQLAYSKKGKNLSLTLDFVDDMMRLKDKVFTAQSRMRSIHQLAVGEDPIDYRTYTYYEELSQEFRHACNWVLEASLVDYPKKIDKLGLSQNQKRKLLSKIQTANKFTQSLRDDPQRDRDVKKIIKRNVDWKWGKE